jgi:hypothetical protein
VLLEQQPDGGCARRAVGVHQSTGGEVVVAAAHGAGGDQRRQPSPSVVIGAAAEEDAATSSMNSPLPAWMVAWATMRLASSLRRTRNGTTRRANRLRLAPPGIEPADVVKWLRRVRGELALPPHGLVEPGQHRVHRDGQFGDFVAGVGHRDAAAEVARAHAVDFGADGAHRAQRPPDREPSDAADEQRGRGHPAPQQPLRGVDGVEPDRVELLGRSDVVAAVGRRRAAVLLPGEAERQDDDAVRPVHLHRLALGELLLEPGRAAVRRFRADHVPAALGVPLRHVGGRDAGVQEREQRVDLVARACPGAVFEAVAQGVHEPVRPEAEHERRGERGEEGDPHPGRPGQEPDPAANIPAKKAAEEIRDGPPAPYHRSHDDPACAVGCGASGLRGGR